MGEVGIGVMLAHLSDYDWRRGRYVGGENKEVYSKHLLGAMGVLINKLWSQGDIVNSQSDTVRISRHAFRNSLCTNAVKCMIDIEYVRLADSEGISRSVTEAVKYTENKLRALVGAKSRLAVKNLPDDYKNIIDSYFDVIFEKVKTDYVEPSYTFDGSALPGDGQTFGVGLGSSNPGSATVADGKLTFVSPQSQGNDTIRIAPSAKYQAFGSENPINTWVFEADITATGTAAKLSNGTNSQLIFRDNSVGTQFAITLGLRHEEGGKLWFQSGSGSSASSVSGTPATNGEKFRLRLEYFINSDSKACIKVFINGTSYGTIVNATNVAHPEISAVNQFRLVIGSNDANTMVLDNVSFYNASIAH
jgi:hypothetical protein